MPFVTDAQINVLHQFGPDGGWPSGNLTITGSTLFGMTQGGGSDGNGVVFGINTNGCGYQVLHNFYRGTAWGTLTLCGSNLYGMVEDEGTNITVTCYGADCYTNGLGAIFQMNTDGSGYQFLHSFNGADGEYPDGSLLLSDSTFYGMTTGGGSNGYGVVFRMNTDGSGYQVMHDFVAYPTDGAYPYGALVLCGSTLYGTTQHGGSTRDGTVFKINTDGSGYQLLHSFDRSDQDNGGVLYGSLTLSDSTLYGMTAYGGSNYMGTVFQINTDGTGFHVLYSFAESEYPYGSLTLSNSTLYGMGVGGPDGVGEVFQVNTDGTGYLVLSSFNNTNGAYPNDSLILAGSTLYGMAQYGGSNDQGVVFSLGLPTLYQAWQLKYFGCADCAPDNADPDGDGMSNLQEYLAGTDPTNCASTLRILSVAQTNNDILLAWATAGGHTNIVQAATDPGGSFSDVGSNIVITGNGDTTTNYLDGGGATNAPVRYYRVRLVP